MAQAPLRAAETWIRLTTPHFEMYTDNSEKSGREAILYFEQVRSFFLQATPNSTATEFPVRIIAFRSDKEFHPYSPNSSAAAYYQPARDRDYIVMSSLDHEQMPTAIHEYMHLIVHHSGIKLPTWLNEGWADVYSTLEPKGKQSLVGNVLPGRAQVLLSEKWLTFDQLTTVDNDSPIYNEKNRSGIFYAESWAFAHMLMLSKEYGPKYHDFVLALNSGKSTADALQLVYNKPPAAVYQDLQAYPRRTIYGGLFDVKLSKSEEEAQVSPAAAMELSLVMANLLAATHKIPEAEAALSKLAAVDPNNPEIPESLGYLKWEKGDRKAALDQFEKALAANTNDARMCFEMASLEQQAGRPVEFIVKPLIRALAIRQDYNEARLQLGFAELNAAAYDGAISAFARVTHIDAEHAPTYFNGFAYALTKHGDLTGARKQLNEAVKWDRTDADKQQTASLNTWLDSLEHPRAVVTRPPADLSFSSDISAPDTDIDIGAPRLRRKEATPQEAVPAMLPSVSGNATKLDCSGKGARLTVMVEGKPMVFDMPDPEKITLKHKGDITFDFQCGDQKPFPVTVEYVPAEKPGPVAGLLKTLAF